jgi:hypothetical protein
MSDEAEEKVQDVVNLAAVGEVSIDEAESLFEGALEKLEHLRKVQEEL